MTDEPAKLPITKRLSEEEAGWMQGELASALIPQEAQPVASEVEGDGDPREVPIMIGAYSYLTKEYDWAKTNGWPIRRRFWLGALWVFARILPKVEKAWLDRYTLPVRSDEEAEAYWEAFHLRDHPPLP